MRGKSFVSACKQYNAFAEQAKHPRRNMLNRGVMMLNFQLQTQFLDVVAAYRNAATLRIVHN